MLLTTTSTIRTPPRPGWDWGWDWDWAGLGSLPHKLVWPVPGGDRVGALGSAAQPGQRAQRSSVQFDPLRRPSLSRPEEGCRTKLCCLRATVQPRRPREEEGGVAARTNNCVQLCHKVSNGFCLAWPGLALLGLVLSSQVQGSNKSARRDNAGIAKSGNAREFESWGRSDGLQLAAV
ncbi:hypothetical protein J3F84DRAFT_105628 [Trichoderma pleuroticola]